MTPAFVTELLQHAAEGLYTELEVFAALMRQLAADNVDAAIAALPDDVQDRFVAWAREHYDNNIPPSQFFDIGGEGALPTPDEAFVALRGWLLRHRLSSSQVDPRIVAIAREALEPDLRTGYWERGDLVDTVADTLDALGLENDKDVTGAAIDAALAVRRAEEVEWRTPSDHDRLVAALTELDRRGIVSREDYGVTIRDAEREVYEEAARLAAHAPVRGVCTFNRQDAENASAGTVLFVSFGAFPPGALDTAIGEEIATTMRAHGLDVDWTGETRHRIGVRVPDWRVRSLTGDPDRPSLRGWRELWGDEPDLSPGRS